jgi:hypothetical protein
MRLVSLAAITLLATPAAAGPFAGEDLFRPPIEWSTWVRAGYGPELGARDVLERGLTLTDPPPTGHWEGALGADASLPVSVHGNFRLGAWVEARTDGSVFGGGELVVTALPRRLDLFLYEGNGILAVRAGRSRDAVTAAIAYGYLAPWKLEGPCRVRFFDIETGVCEPRPPRATRYMVGVRVVANVTRSLDDPREWSATLGLETEPLGALRAMLGLRSWY